MVKLVFFKINIVMALLIKVNEFKAILIGTHHLIKIKNPKNYPPHIRDDTESC
jgi:hypothetical protein